MGAVHHFRKLREDLDVQRRASELLGEETILLKLPVEDFNRIMHLVNHRLKELEAIEKANIERIDPRYFPSDKPTFLP